MRSKQTTTTEWMAGALLIGLCIVLIVRMVATPGDKVGVALQATARWSFVLFWPAYAGNALYGLFGERFHALAQHCRDFSLSFASAQLAHLGMVAWMLYGSDTPFPRSSLVFFGIAVFWIYFLALLSMKSLAAKLDPKVLRIVRTLGVEYIALVFLVDFAKNPFQGGIINLFIYLPFLGLAIAGPLLRFAAAAKRIAQARALAT